ncbi:MAG: cytochrome c biogenesis protein ResB, partial [Desulfobacterales bacterium]
MISLAATSIVGTVIPQNEDPTSYFEAFGPFLYRVFDVLDLFDMYHSWWFQLLLLLLTANLTICSIERLRATWKIIFVKNPTFHISRFRKLPHKAEFEENRSPEKLIRLYDQFIAKRFRYSRRETTERGFCIYAEKGRLTRLGVYTVHLSVVLLLVGGLIGSLFGFEGYMNVPEGESSQTVHLRNSAAVQQLGFEIRCDDFKVSFYENGSPKEYRSTLTILQQGKPVLTKDIIVNDPLGYGGIRIFQSSYGPLGPESVTLDIKSNATGMVYSKKVKIGQQFD